MEAVVVFIFIILAVGFICIVFNFVHKTNNYVNTTIREATLNSKIDAWKRKKRLIEDMRKKYGDNIITELKLIENEVDEEYLFSQLLRLQSTKSVGCIDFAPQNAKYLIKYFSMLASRLNSYDEEMLKEKKRSFLSKYGPAGARLLAVILDMDFDIPDC